MFIFINANSGLHIIFEMLFLKQIQVKKAKKICHRYKCLMEKKKNGGDKWKKKQKKKLKKLPKSVTKASRHLCRKLLRYKGDLKV